MDIMKEVEEILSKKAAFDLDKEIESRNQSYQKLVEELASLNQQRQELVNYAIELMRQKDANHASQLAKIDQRRLEVVNGMLRLEGAVKALQDLKQKEG